MWIKLSNKGEFDVIKACSMLGASVKETADPIGLYGSGIKYALAQSIRQNIPIVITSGKTRFDVSSKPEVFRNETFQVVCLGEHSTGITSQFGKEDWNDDWFIFREFYSNMLDENGVASVVHEILPEDGTTSVFLPYDTFSYIYLNILSYFNKQPSGTVREGTGQVFKKGVFVGHLDLKLDFWHDGIKITESRTLDRSSAIDCLNWSLKPEHFPLLQEGDDVGFLSLHLDQFWAKSIHEYYRSTVPRYMLCIRGWGDSIKEAGTAGFIPVVLPDCFNDKDIKQFSPPLVTVFKLFPNGDLVKPTPTQRAAIRKALRTLKPVCEFPIKKIGVLDANDLYTLGSYNFQTQAIGLNMKLFDDHQKLVKVLLHEIGHHITKANDYQRAFTNFFVEKLTEKLCST